MPLDLARNGIEYVKWNWPEIELLFSYLQLLSGLMIHLIHFALQQQSCNQKGLLKPTFFFQTQGRKRRRGGGGSVGNEYTPDPSVIRIHPLPVHTHTQDIRAITCNGQANLWACQELKEFATCRNIFSKFVDYSSFLSG